MACAPRPPRDPSSPEVATTPALLAAAAAGAMSHVALDVASGAPIAVCWPLSVDRASLPLVAMADPWIIGICVLGVLALLAGRDHDANGRPARCSASRSFLCLKAAMLAARLRIGSRPRLPRTIEARWGALTEWLVFDRTPDASSALSRSPAAAIRPVPLLSQPLRIRNRRSWHASRALETVREFSGGARVRAFRSWRRRPGTHRPLVGPVGTALRRPQQGPNGPCGAHLGGRRCSIAAVVRSGRKCELDGSCRLRPPLQVRRNSMLANGVPVSHRPTAARNPRRAKQSRHSASVRGWNDCRRHVPNAKAFSRLPTRTAVKRQPAAGVGFADEHDAARLETGCHPREQRLLLRRRSNWSTSNSSTRGCRFERASSARRPSMTSASPASASRAIAATRRRISMPVMRVKRGGGGHPAGHVPASYAWRASASSASISPCPQPMSTRRAARRQMPRVTRSPGRSGSIRSLPRANSQAVMLPPRYRSDARRTRSANGDPPAGGAHEAVGPGRRQAREQPADGDAADDRVDAEDRDAGRPRSTRASARETIRAATRRRPALPRR